jgi:hypothetical protein
MIILRFDSVQPDHRKHVRSRHVFVSVVMEKFHPTTQSTTFPISGYAMLVEASPAVSDSVIFSHDGYFARAAPKVFFLRHSIRTGIRCQYGNSSSRSIYARSAEQRAKP